MSNLTNNDYKTILEYYNKSIPNQRDFYNWKLKKL